MKYGTAKCLVYKKFFEWSNKLKKNLERQKISPNIYIYIVVLLFKKMHNQLLNLKHHRKVSFHRLEYIAETSHTCVPEEFIGDIAPRIYVYDFHHIANSLTPIPPLNA